MPFCVSFQNLPKIKPIEYKEKERKKETEQMSLFKRDERVYSRNREREMDGVGYCLALKREEDPMTRLLAIKALLEIFYLKVGEVNSRLFPAMIQCV